MPTPIEALLATIHTLRSPGGCPWDQKQTLPDAARYLLDEAGELLEASLLGEVPAIQEELGDLLFMVCFCCEILGETAPVDLQTVARTGNDKLVRRHPHVFGGQPAADTTESQERWNEIKAAEKRANGQDPDQDSVLKDLSAASAPLHQAYSYQQDAATVGFDWPDISGVWEKLAEELDELRSATADGSPDGIEHELGDLLFTVANLARFLRIQPDLALRRANQRFRTRFHYLEEHYGRDRARMRDASLEELETVWQEAKRRNGPTA